MAVSIQAFRHSSCLNYILLCACKPIYSPIYRERSKKLWCVINIYLQKLMNAHNNVWMEKSVSLLKPSRSNHLPISEPCKRQSDLHEQDFSSMLTSPRSASFTQYLSTKTKSFICSWGKPKLPRGDELKKSISKDTFSAIYSMDRKKGFNYEWKWAGERCNMMNISVLLIHYSNAAQE